MIDKLLGRTMTIEKAMDATWLRNDATSQNIANVDTPGYKRKSVSFEEQLSAKMSENGIVGNRTDERHIPIGGSNIENVTIRVSEDNKNQQMRQDGNNVDIDAEMALLAKNSIKYNALIQRFTGSMKTLKSVISEGRK